LDHGQTTKEVVNVTAAVGTTLTVTRGQDGTSAAGHTAGAVVAHTVVARDLSEPQAHIAATSNVHGLTGGANVVGDTQTQTLTNKTLTSPTITGATISGGVATLNNATTLTIKDDNLILQDGTDTTKQAVLQLSGITTGTTRTYTLPNASSTLVDLSTAQTLTSKSLTSPTITGTGTAAVASLTVNSVDYTPGGAAWVTWSPTLTNLTLGNGTVTAKYWQLGKTIHYRFKFMLGSTSAVGTSPRFTLPATVHADYVGDADRVGIAFLVDSGVAFYDGVPWYRGSNNLIEFMALNAAGATASLVTVTATVPFTWGTSDALVAYGTYDAA
jgi:hypothetical protein